MKQTTSLLPVLLIGWAGTSVIAAPASNDQLVFGHSSPVVHTDGHGGPQDQDPGPFHPLHHLSALSPYFVPGKAITRLPNPTCNVTTSSILIRHSSIMSNDGDREGFMQPFIEKVSEWQDDVFYQPPKGWSLEKEVKKWTKSETGSYDEDVSERKWWFLQDWETPIDAKYDGKLSEQGKRDSKVRAN